MPRLSNLPPGVTDAMIEEQAGGDAEPTIMSLKEVREVLQSYCESENDTDAVFAAKEMPDLCATVEALSGALKALEWRQNVCPCCLFHQATGHYIHCDLGNLLAQLERQE